MKANNAEQLTARNWQDVGTAKGHDPAAYLHNSMSTWADQTPRARMLKFPARGAHAERTWARFKSCKVAATTPAGMLEGVQVWKLNGCKQCVANSHRTRLTKGLNMRTVYFNYHTHRYGSSGITSHSMMRTIAVLRAMDEKPKSQWVAIIQKDRRGWLETFRVIEASPSLDEVKSALEERFKDLGELSRLIKVAIIKTGPRGGLDRKERVVFFSAQNWTLSDF